MALRRYTNVLLVRPKTIVSENDSFRKDFCFTADVFLFFFHSPNLRDAWADRREILHGGQNRPYFITPVQNFGGAHPKKISGAKKHAKFGPILDDFKVR